MLGCALDVQEKEHTALHWAADKRCDGGHDNTCTASPLVRQLAKLPIPRFHAQRVVR